MRHYTEHLIHKDTKIRDSLPILNKLAIDAILFVIDDESRLIGSITDGDIRRGLIDGIDLEERLEKIIQPNPKYFKKGDLDFNKVTEYRDNNYRIIPIIDNDDKIINVINFGYLRSYLPIDVVIMAGGKGSRLRPLTLDKPKPMLLVGDKPILEHNINRLSLYGVDDFWITLNYLGEQIEDYFGNGKDRNLNIQYVWENQPLGTIGSVSNINNLIHDTILVTNSDILTNLDYEDFYIKFIEEDADFAVVTIPYKVDIPYAVLETSNGHVINFKEKPTYTYYSNAGIYLMKRDILNRIPINESFNATDLMESLITDGKKVLSYPLSGYWLDIGKHDDFEKAQKDIDTVKF